MNTNRPIRILLTIILLSLTSALLMAQGHGGPGGPGGGGHGGGHGGPGGPGQGGFPHDTTGCDSSGFEWDHDGPGGPGHGGGHDGDHWGHGDSTGCDSSGFGGHHGSGHGGPGHGGHRPGWGHGDSTSLDSIQIGGSVTTLLDTITFGGGPCHPDSGEFVRTQYFLDVDADELADYKLVNLRRLARHDSTFVLPVDGDEITVSGFLVPREDELDRIIVLTLVYGVDTGSAGSLMATDPAIKSTEHALNVSSYPNPFNPSTNIEFTLSHAGQTHLKIYDLRGVEVAQLLNHQLDAGQHSVQFNPGTLSAGTYIYVLETSDSRSVGRIAYLK